METSPMLYMTCLSVYIVPKQNKLILTDMHMFYAVCVQGFIQGRGKLPPKTDMDQTNLAKRHGWRKNGYTTVANFLWGHRCAACSLLAELLVASISPAAP